MSTRRVAITLNLPREEVERSWRTSEYRPTYVDAADAAVEFVEAPGDRGTEIHVDLELNRPAGKIGEMVQKLIGSEPLAKVKDDLRRFKAYAETGEIPRSDASPEGELAERKLKQRPAQPLDENELKRLQEVGV
jgi:nucleoside-diphosphate-sugar epimerase